MKPMISINDETREMTDQEFDEYQNHLEAVKIQKQFEAAEESKREAVLTKLEKLGLTAEDLRLLGL